MTEGKGFRLSIPKTAPAGAVQVEEKVADPIILALTLLESMAESLATVAAYYEGKGVVEGIFEPEEKEDAPSE